MWIFIRSHLAWKIFLTYLIVIVVGIVVLFTATNLTIPTSFNRHMAGMSAMMTGNNMMGSAQSSEMELFKSYQSAVNESLTLAATAALLAAMLASYFISRQVVGPVQKMMGISKRISEGEYKERLTVSGVARTNQLDELDQLALSFNQMAEKLDKTESMRKQLIGDVSHELRTPLTAIKGYMEGLIDGVIPANNETFSLIHSEADRLSRLVNDLQELSRVEAGSYQLKLEPISPVTLVDLAKSRLAAQFSAKGISITTRFQASSSIVSVDQDRMIQVFTNLLGNALLYTPQGGQVTILTRLQNDQFIFSIADTGIGISTEQLPFVFDRFYRTDKSRTRASGGSGIGLTIARAIVRAHGGRIWVTSDGEGKGSTFFVSLPIQQEKVP
jgi:histidine kinase